ncbi:MAG TPA: hypothetical protein VF824_20820 [Thermoanaerobaculia bacterium]|jgi:hypothetical protein
MKKLALALATFALAAPLFAQSGGCVGVAFGSEQKNKGKFDAVFSATQVIDVDLSVLFHPGTVKQYAGNHKVEVRIYTPRGHLYQSMTVPFTADASRKGSHVAIEGYPQTLETQLLEEVTTASGKQLRAFVRLPVAGTPIVTSSIYGTWSAQAYVDDAPIACSKPATFRVTE